MKTFLLITLWLGVFSASAQNENREVERTIQSLFEGMKKGDSAQVHRSLSNELVMQTIVRDKSNQVRMSGGSLKDFLNAVGKPHQEVWNEEIWNLTVRIDGDFAQAWCDYAFYIDHTFSHCGVDAFHLVRTADGWKIFQLVDTRRKSGCTIPEEIQKKHKS